MTTTKLTNTPGFDTALAALIKRVRELDFMPVIASQLEFEAGGEFQIGDDTYEHDNASISVSYYDPSFPRVTLTFCEDLDNYESATGRTGFAGLMEDLLAVALEAGTTPSV